MGAKTWMLAYVEGDAKEILKSNPHLDRAAVFELAGTLFPSEILEPIDDGDLLLTSPPDDEILVGCFPGLSIIAASEFGIDNPSCLPASFLDAATGSTVYLHAMHSVVDWFAYAKWVNGELVRSLSLSPDSGILEDIGERAGFEESYWSGEHPVFDSADEDQAYPFPFHPLDLGEAALLEFFGYQIEGLAAPDQLKPEDIPLAAFKRVRPQEKPLVPTKHDKSGKPWWKSWWR